jgi:hypothetical protein
MLRRFVLALGIAAALVVSAHASDLVFPGGGTIAQIVDGGGTYSIITLVNLDSTAANYSLYFIGDNGVGVFLDTTAGTAAILSGTIPVGGSTIIRTNGNSSTVQQAYGVLVTTSQIAGSAVFGIPLAHSPIAEASVPVDTGFDYIIGIPFDQTTASYGVALANSFGDGQYQSAGGQTANLSISFLDQTGSTFFSTTMQIPYLQHTAFMLDSQFPQTAGRTGTMIIRSIDNSTAAISACGSAGCPYAIKALALRANAAGTTFTTITPLIPCNSSGQSCTN